MNEPEISPILLFSLIVNVALLIWGLMAVNHRDKMSKTMLRILVGNGLGKHKELFEKLTFYAKRAQLNKLKALQYEKALQHYHSEMRSATHVNHRYMPLTFAELCDKLVEEKHLMANYYRNSFSKPDTEMGMSESLKDITKVG